MRAHVRDLVLYAGICLVLSALACGADDPNKPPERTPAQGFLWQVDSGTATVYLLGVIHVGNDRFYPLSPTIESAFARADVLVQETKVDKESQQLLYKTVAEAGTYPPQESLEQHLSPEVRALYESYSKRPYVDPNSLRHYRPWVVAWMISMNEGRRLGYFYGRNVSTYFQKQAEGKKEIVGLETPAEYAALFRTLPNETQEAVLRATLAHIDTLPETMERLIELWRKGNWRAAKEMAAELLGGPDVMSSFGGVRDERMVAKIEEYLKTNRTYFVTVGAAHFVRKDGIIERLRRRGHTVKWLGPEEYAVPRR